MMNALLNELSSAALEAGRTLVLGPRAPLPLAPTPRDVVFADGTARLYRFHAGASARSGPPILLVPSLINRWYVLDLRPGASLVEHLVGEGFEVFCLDWGVPGDEDRYLDWEAVLARLARFVRRTRRLTGGRPLGLLGYCMGATLAGIHLALHPKSAQAFVNLAGPFDFSEAGFLGCAVDARWFDPAAVADAGNVTTAQMESGFSALRPTAALAKFMARPERWGRPEQQLAFQALDTWARDNVPFPGAAYRTYIEELYQQNRLARGEHRVAGRRVDLGQLRSPVLTVTASRDVICPAPAATALNRLAGTEDTEVITVPGGHVGAVVGRRASAELYPALASWFRERLAAPKP